MPADLHVHTNYSDGTCSPQEIVELAAKAGLKTIAITDHDGVDGIEPAQSAGEKFKVEVIAGIEFTTEIRETEIHILGYFIDYKNSELLSILAKIQEDRIKRIYKIVEKLKGLGVNISAQKVLAMAKGKAPGRPHVARVLLEEGLVGNFKEAFDRYLDFHAPAYVSHYKLTPLEAVKLIKDTGGIPVYAHPAVSNCDRIIPELMGAGLLGIEVYYPGHNREKTQHYLNLAQKYGLLVTGGSDYHGFKSGREVTLGEMTVPDELVDKLKLKTQNA